VHSADLMVMSWSTGRFDGQTLAHLAQSMHSSGSRRMRLLDEIGRMAGLWRNSLFWARQVV